jgi:hypothetical protein
MASAADTPRLPILYRDLQPLSSVQHGDLRLRQLERTDILNEVHALPLTVEEFIMAQRSFPIVFSAGEEAVPLALFGLNEGVNLFIDEDGQFLPGVYVPAYARRYPFMLAQLNPDSQELSLCFDPTSESIGGFGEGEALFDGDKPSEMTRGILEFCEQFEMAVQRTAGFVKDLIDNKLLIDGELTIQPDGAEQPFVYRGFRMVDEQAVNELRGDVARKLVKSGAMALIYAHLFSLGLTRDLFGRQLEAGKVPAPQIANPA